MDETAFAATAGKRDLGRNGTYLVLRDLSQEGPAFWQFINEQAARDREDRNTVAAATVGRTPSHIPIVPSDRNLLRNDEPTGTIPPGAPIVPLSGGAIPGVGPDPEDIQRHQFTFHDDVDGTACPYGPISAAPIRATPISRKGRGACWHG